MSSSASPTCLCRRLRFVSTRCAYATSCMSPWRKRYSLVGRRRFSTIRSRRWSSERALMSSSCSTSRSRSCVPNVRPITAASWRTSRAQLEPVEPCLQRALDKGGDRKLLELDAELPAAVLAPEGAALDQVAPGLLEEEGVAAGPLCEQLRHVVGHLPLGGVADEHPARVARERRQLDLPVAVRVELPRALAQLPGAQRALAPIEQEEADGSHLGDREQRLEEIERRLVPIVQVLEEDGERPLVRQPHEEVRDVLERLHLDALAVELAKPLGCVWLDRQAHDRREERIDLLGVLEELGQLRLELQADTCLGSRGADSQPFAEQLADRPVGEGLCVRDDRPSTKRTRSR